MFSDVRRSDARRVRLVPAVLSGVAFVCAGLLFACLDGATTPGATVARLVITAPDTAGLPGTVLGLMATAYDTAGVVVPDVRVRWLSFDTTIAVVDSTGHARLGPVTSSVSVSATDSASSAADTIILHVARE